MSDYLSDEEQVAVLKKWWDENGKSLLIGLVVAVVAVLGWRGYQDYTRAEAESASTLYQAYQEQRALETQNPDALARLAESLEKEHPASGYRTFVLFYEAAEAAAEENYTGARERLQLAVAAVGDARLKDIARIRLARIEQQLGETDAALASLGQVRSEGFYSEVAELKGDILLAQGDRTGAADAYAAAIELAGTTQNPLLELKAQDLNETGTEADVEPAP